MSIWDERYSESVFAYGKDPNDFLVANIGALPRGRALCLAEGEGRNAVFLAGHGFSVHAIDQSEVGLSKARAFAAENGVKITTETADLGVIAIEPSAWDCIVSVFAHVPSAIRKRLHSQVVHALAPNGVFILEAYTRRQLEIGGTGGPKADQIDLFMSLASLREELSGLDFLHAIEIERDVNEGRFHAGNAAVVQVIARKRA
jgi:SAM-dependent methyltransferase